MGMTRLACGCGRRVPVHALWTALWDQKDLRCARCEALFTIADLRHLVEVDDYTRTVYAIYTQLVRYGWTSSDALENAGTTENNHLLGAVLTHLQSAGLIQRKEGMEADGVPLFIRGPRFPSARLARQEDRPR